MSKDSSGSSPYLKSIAQQLRQIPDLLAKHHIRQPLHAENAAGRLIEKAIEAGAFSDVHFATMRTQIDDALQNSCYSTLFMNSSYWLVILATGDKPKPTEFKKEFSRNIDIIASAIEAELRRKGIKPIGKILKNTKAVPAPASRKEPDVFLKGRIAKFLSKPPGLAENYPPRFYGKLGITSDDLRQAKQSGKIDAIAPQTSGNATKQNLYPYRSVQRLWPDKCPPIPPKA